MLQDFKILASYLTCKRSLLLGTTYNDDSKNHINLYIDERIHNHKDSNQKLAKQL